MSLILEALRKSEAERQLGRAPGLMTPMLHAPRRRAWLWPLLLVLPILVLAGAAGWWFGRGGAIEPEPVHTEATVATGPVAQDPSAPASDPAPMVAAPQPATPPPEPRTAARSAAETVTPTAPSAADERATADPAPPSNSSDPAVVQAVPAGEPSPSASASTVAAPSSSAPAHAAEDAAPTEIAETRPADAATPTAAAAAVPAESLPTLPMLEPALRDGLPPLRMSMHVYAAPVDQRFVLIDGRRYAEGQAIDQRLQIAEIRRDGVVLTVDGRRFLLPRS